MKKLIVLTVLLSSLSWAKIKYISGLPNDNLSSKRVLDGTGYVPIGFPCNATFDRKTKRAVLVLHKSNFNRSLLEAINQKTNIKVELDGEYYRLSWNNFNETFSPYVDSGIAGYQSFWLKNSDRKFTDHHGNFYTGSFNSYLNLDKDSGKIYAIHLQSDFKCWWRKIEGESLECERADLAKNKTLSCYVTYKINENYRDR